MNKLKHLKPLSKLKSSKGIELLSATVSPGNHCPMRMASVISREIDGLSTILIGMEECTIHSRLFSPNPEGDNKELHWLYLLDSNEVVFGCRVGLMKAIRAMSLKGVEHLMLIITCVPELIGEDIEGIVLEASRDFGIEIGFAKLGQFKNTSYPPGYRITLEEMVKFIDEKDKNEKRINILGRKENEDHIEKPSFIEKLSKKYKIKYLAPGTAIDDFKNSGDSVLNLVISSHAVLMAQEMETKLDIPYIRLYDKYSSFDIDKMYREIDEKLGSKLVESNKKLKDELDKLEKKVKAVVTGMSYILGNRIDNSLPLVGYFTSLGMKAELVHLEEYYDEDKSVIKKILEENIDPLVCRMANTRDDVDIVREIKPDLCIGIVMEEIKGVVQLNSMMELYGQVGYERSISVLQMLISELERVM